MASTAHSEVTFDFAKAPEEQRIAAYGALFSLAAADGELSHAELQRLFEMIDLDGLSLEGRRRVAEYISKPPSLRECVGVLAHASDDVRFGVVMLLVDLALIDETVSIIEHDFLQTACDELRVSEDQLAAMKNVVRKAREVANTDGKDPAAIDALKTAVKGLSAVGVPITAVYFSGTVIGLSAAGITSGLAGILGLSVGMLPGLGIAVLLGVATYWGISKAFGIREKRVEKKHRVEQERRAQLIVRNLQRVIDDLGQALDRETSMSQANKVAIESLSVRLESLKRTLQERAAV